MKEGFAESVKCLLVHLWCIQNKLVLKKDIDIIHVAMGGGGVKKSFHTCWGGVQKVLAASEGGVKKVWRQKFSIAQPPHQSIYEHSLKAKYIRKFFSPSEIDVVKYHLT